MKSLQALLALFACAVLPLHAADLSDLTWTTTGGEVTITDCKISASGELVIPDTIGGNPVTSIGNNAFQHCSSLTSITIPEGVTSIGIATFANCSSLTSITIGDSVTSIGDSAFFQCIGLTSIAIPDSVTSIEVWAFSGCTSLRSIIFRGSAPIVGNLAFSGVADGAVALVTIEDQASFGDFGTDWNGLTLDRILTWTTTGGEVTITNCDEAASGELVIPDTIGDFPVTSIGGHAFSGCSSLTSITMGDSVTSIGRQAFFNCTILTSITIPDSVTSIGWLAFASCSSLTSINVGAGNLNYTDVNGVLFNKGKTVLLTYPEGKTGANYTIPDSVTSIGDDAFYGCSSLTSVTIPDSVTSIGVHAFFGCSNLTSITIGNGVTSIGEWAFRFCRSLTSITFLGTAPIVVADAFSGAAEGATAYVDERFAASFGIEGSIWAGLTVAIQRPFAITACGFVNTSTFFIEFEPAGAGYRVMSSSTLDFGNAVEVTPTLQPTSAGDNRFEFTASGSRNFYRLEPIQ